MRTSSQDRTVDHSDAAHPRSDTTNIKPSPLRETNSASASAEAHAPLQVDRVIGARPADDGQAAGELVGELDDLCHARQALLEGQGGGRRQALAEGEHPPAGGGATVDAAAPAHHRTGGPA